VSFLIFGLFWLHFDHAPLWVQAAFVAACLYEKWEERHAKR